MLSSRNENFLARSLAIGAAFTTVFVVSGDVTDPVNVTKFLSLGLVSMWSFFFLVGNKAPNPLLSKKKPLILIILFVTSVAISVVNSPSPISQLLWGAYGRNNGALTYLFLSLLFLASLALTTKKSFKGLIVAILFAGLINSIYAVVVLVDGDFIGWNNPRNLLFGTLGNTNFFGSFMGIFFSALVCALFFQEVPKWVKIALIAMMPLVLLEIYKSQAIQGRVLVALGLGVIGFYYIRAKASTLATAAYSVLSFSLGLLALLGALQIGPLRDYIYKTSVSLRGQYWLAGWNTGNSHPLTGVGMDAFGDWYRRSRDPHSLELPGVNVVVNASHNVPVDMFAFGGIPLLASYLALVVFVGVSIFKVTRRQKAFDPVFTALVASWLGYQVQSIISINQIGLAIWGWLLGGAIIAYDSANRDLEKFSTSEFKSSQKRNTGTVNPRGLLLAFVGAFTGLLISLPPLVADSQWRNSQVARNVELLEKTMKPSFFNPQNSTKYLANIQVLEQSNMPDLARKYAKQAVVWNPDAYELWKILFLISGSTKAEKELALENMKRLDPLNPDVTATQ